MDGRFSLPFFRGIDGVYDATNGGVTATLSISGTEALLSLSGGLEARGLRVEKHGQTIKFSGGHLFLNGRPESAMQDPTSDVGTIGDDGQTITMHVGSGELRFVKR